MWPKGLIEKPAPLVMCSWEREIATLFLNLTGGDFQHLKKTPSPSEPVIMEDSTNAQSVPLPNKGHVDRKVLLLGHRDKVGA